MTEHVLAIDIGGTKIAVAVIDASGTVVTEAQAPTPATLDPEAIFAPAAAAIARIAADASWDGPVRVGIGSAGPIDGPAGTISPVNIPGWRRYPIVDRVRTVVAAAVDAAPETVAVGLAGDGHCFALGEHWLGAGRDWTSMVGMVLSTGVGGGAVIDNRLFTGVTGNSVHLGHISVNAWGERCVCGCHGCVEMYARGPAMVAEARARGWDGGTDAQALTADARAGHPVAVAVIDHGMRALAAGIASTATNLDIRTFVLGGGVSKAGAVVFDPLRRHLEDFAALPFVQPLEVRPAELENAGILGAAALALGDARFGTA
ncbi:glucokinase [Friedmanniella endophytica]|uniref:Glucokinase n=2 Tax=Microlunatus kandeliicorticis TaxID=1759536 RepID=A0A7W3IV12_9ACTN|nr:glucokinase [Microlunatus kandeliicorticis]